MSLEKTNKGRFVLLLLLVMAIAVLWWMQPGARQSDVSPTIFQLSETDQINRVELEYKGEKILLAFDGNKWKVNDTLDADRQMVKVLFATMNQVEARRAVAESLRDSIVTRLKVEGVRARFFEGNALVQDIVVGGNARKSVAYFKRGDDEVPYVTVIPGYRVYAAGIFEQSANQWRDKRVFNFNWRNFTGLSVSFPKEPAESFSVSLNGSYFGIDGLAAVDTTRLNDYLDALSLLEASSFYEAGTNDRYDSLLQVPPSFSIEVRDMAGRVHPLTIFPPIRNHGVVVGQIGQERVLFQRSDIVQIAKKKAYFQSGQTGRQNP